MSIYSKSYNSFLYPLYESIFRRRNTIKYLRELERNQWLTEEELKKIQWNKMKALLQHAYDFVPYYKDAFNALKLRPSDIEKPQDFTRLPILTKESIQNKGVLLQAENYSGMNTSSNETGGSTGEPIRFVFPRDSYEWRMAAAMRSNKWTGWEPGKNTTLIWGSPVTKRHPFIHAKIGLHHFLMRRQYINAFHLSEQQLKSQIEKINEFEPEFIESYVSSLYKIAKYIYENNIKCVRPKAIITSAEMLYPHQRELIEKIFESRIFNRYGCSEVMLIAAECERHDGMHLNVDNLYIEFLKDNKAVKPGESGEIVLTDLNNYGMPFIRYKVGDIGIPLADRCGCGRGLPLMENIEGRSVDILLTSDGHFIQPQMFCFLFNEFDWIRQYQIYQKSRGHLTFRIVRKNDIFESDKNYFVKRVNEVMRGKVEINLEFVNEIPLTRSGKFRLVVSDIPSDFQEKEKEVETAV